VVKGVRRWLLGVILVLAVFGAVTALSYAVLNNFYGAGNPTISTQTIVIENSGQQVTIDNVEYRVTNAELSADNENFYLLDLFSRSYTGAGPLAASPAQGEQGYNAPSIAGAGTGTITKISVPADAYDKAQTSGEPVIVSNTTTTETKPIDASPIAATIGIAMSVVALAVWAGYRQMWGDATSTLLEQGLNDMTVRDVEIVGYIMELGEFTIPELMKTTKASKITVWRTVQKLVEKGLVQRTEKTKLAANGFGGRGKPSSVYRYVGAKSEQTKK
jgi:predicted transcriptional regulator